MDCVPVLREHNPFCFVATMVSRLLHPPDVHTVCPTDEQGRRTAVAPPLGSIGRYVIVAANCSNGKRRSTVSSAPRIRLQGHRSGIAGAKRGRSATRGKHNQPADGQERVPVAKPFVVQKGTGGIFHRTHGNNVGEATHHGSLSEQHRNGRWNIRSRSREPAPLRISCQQND